MFEDDFLEFDYESRNGSDDFYSYNSRDFDEGWSADTLTDEEILLLLDEDESDMSDI